MIKKTYCSEIEALLIQFISAFDDCRIRRYDKSTNTHIDVIPRWIVAPKTRVFADIVNQAGNITLPVAVVNVKSINLRKDDLFNKQLDQRKYINGEEYRSMQPVPVTINLSVHFYTKFISEIWQLMANFASFNKPYSFISWQNPTYLNKQFIEEVRSKVLWDGTFNINAPENLTEEQQWVLEGSAGFTIEGFLFEPDADTTGIITSVQHYLNDNRYTTQFFSDTGSLDYYEKDGWPSVTNLFSSKGFRYNEDVDPIFFVEKDDIVTIEGRSFFKNKNTGILIVKEDESPIKGLTLKNIETIKMGTISGYELESKILDDNHIEFTMPDISLSSYNIIIYNKAGYIKLDITIKNDKKFIIPAGTYVISDISIISTPTNNRWINELITFDTDTVLDQNDPIWTNKVIWNTDNLDDIKNTGMDVDRTSGKDILISFLYNKTVSSDKFVNCYSITKFVSPLPNLIIGKDMFVNCYKLHTFTSNLDNLTSGNQMFYECKELYNFDVKLPKLNDGYNMFKGCNKLSILSIVKILKSLSFNDTNCTITFGLTCTNIDGEIVDTQTELETNYPNILNDISSKNWTITYA